MAWMNNDGLYLKYGTEKTTVNVAGEYLTYGPLRTIETQVTLSSLSSTPAILSDTTFFPDRARISDVVVYTETASTGSTASSLDVGLIATSRSSEIDYQAFVKGLPQTSLDASGEVTTLIVGSTAAGDLIGTTTTLPGYITANRGSSVAFGSGVLKVRVNYYMT